MSFQRAGTWAIRARSILLLGFTLAAIGCATQQASAGSQGPHELPHDGTLLGRVFDVHGQRFVSGDALFTALTSSELVLLGETHDDRSHHQLEADLVSSFTQAHAGARIAFEMLDEAQGQALASHAPQTPEELATIVSWDASGWPEFALYRPVFAAVLSAHATIVAAHPSRERVHQSMAGVSADEARDLQLEPPLSAADAEAQRQEIKSSHCGQAPDDLVQAMQRAQSYKDAFMAKSMLSQHAPTLLIAGRGHIRNDRGVPLFLRRAGAPHTLSVAFIETTPEHEQPTDDELSAYDYAIFTPATGNEDPCVRFKAQLEKLHQQAQP